jgi:hypothetical protein
VPLAVEEPEEAESLALLALAPTASGRPLAGSATHQPNSSEAAVAVALAVAVLEY